MRCRHIVFLDSGSTFRGAKVANAAMEMAANMSHGFLRDIANLLTTGSMDIPDASGTEGVEIRVGMTFNFWTYVIFW